MRSLFFCALMCLGGPAAAQQLLGQFYTMLGQQDLYNSSGVPLDDFGAWLQQDRANFHRFGRPDEMDEWDPYFGDKAMRAALPQLYRAGGGAPQLERQIRQYGSAFVLVQVYGGNGFVSYVVVSQGAG